MDMSLIVLIGLPVLYLTGNLKKAVAAAGIRGAVFVLYFVIAVLLSLAPAVYILPNLSVSLSGAFLCIAPAVYIGLQGGYTYRFFLASSLTALLSVSVFFVINTLALPYLSPVPGLAMSAVAILCHGRRAAEYAPVLAGLFGAVDSIMVLLTDTARAVVLFDVSAMATLSLSVCLLAAFLSLHTRHRHPARHARGPSPQTQHNKG